MAADDAFKHLSYSRYSGRAGITDSEITENE